MDCRPIGLFDSGVGGLSLVKEMRRQLPQERLIYFADTLHMPYGPRSRRELRHLVFAILRFLHTNNVKLIIMACNTSSALLYEEAGELFDTAIFDVIRPVANYMAPGPSFKLGIIATEATVRSAAYSKILLREGFKGSIYSQACPSLASLVEAGAGPGPLQEALVTCLKPLRQEGIEKLLLGCTHYAFVRKLIAGLLGDNIALIDPAYYGVQAVKNYLEKKQMLCKARGDEFLAYASGPVAQFAQRAGQLLGYTPLVKAVRWQGSAYTVIS